MFTTITRAEERPRRNRFIEHSVPLISMVLVELTTKLRIDYMQELQYAIIVFSLLLFEVREIKRFLKSCYRDPRKILRVSRNYGTVIKFSFQHPTKLRIDYMQELQYAIIVFSLLLFEVREIKRFLKSCYRDPRKILRVSRNSILDSRASNLDARSSIASSIEFRVETVNLHLHGTVIKFSFISILQSNVV